MNFSSAHILKQILKCDFDRPVRIREFFTLNEAKSQLPPYGSRSMMGMVTEGNIIYIKELSSFMIYFSPQIFSIGWILLLRDWNERETFLRLWSFTRWPVLIKGVSIVWTSLCSFKSSSNCLSFFVLREVEHYLWRFYFC